MSPLDQLGFSVTDLRTLLTGAGGTPAIQRLRAARLSRHKLLVEAARRAMVPESTECWDLLSRAQARDPAVVDDVLAMPQVGAWAFDSLCGRVHTAGYPSVACITAAVRAGEDFVIDVPSDGGSLVFPGLGMLKVPGERSSVRLRSHPTGVQAEGAVWEDVPRVTVKAGGLTLDVALEADDPHLARYEAKTRRPDEAELDRWRSLLDGAWRIVVETDPMAADMAADVRVVVPLESIPGQEPLSATSGWAPGAIALSLADDALTLAEILVHEYRHYLLGLVEEIVPLVDPDSEALCYAPWRDDPRPPSGLIHGCFAHLAVTAFWRRRRELCPPESRAEAEVQFARWRDATLTGIEELIDSRALTEAGEALTTAMWEQLDGWQSEPVATNALERAQQVTREHRLRWRLSHLEPDNAAVSALVDDWRKEAAPRSNPVFARVVPAHRAESSEERTSPPPPPDEQSSWIDLASTFAPVFDRIEVAYAVFDRLRQVGTPASPTAVLSWMAAATFSVVQRRS